MSPQHGVVDLEQTAGDSRLVVGGAAGWQPRAIGVEFELGLLPGFFDGPDEFVVDVRYFKTRYADAGRAGFSERLASFTRLTGGVVLRFSR